MRNPFLKTEFEHELRDLLNRYSRESASNTPDEILAEYIEDSLAAFNRAVQRREVWYGRDGIPPVPKTRA